MSWSYKKVDIGWRVYAGEELICTTYSEKAAIEIVEGHKVVEAALAFAERWDVGDTSGETDLVDTVDRYLRAMERP